MKRIILMASVVFAFAFTSTDKVDTLKVDTQKSKVKWTGYHLAKSYEHTGFVEIKSGQLQISGNSLKGGEIVMDMTSITNTDVENEGKNKKLVNHLKSDEFFGVEKFPDAKIVIKKSKKEDDVYKTTADLTIRGITKEIMFDTVIKSISNDKFEATAKLRVPRTEFEVMYGWSIENAMLDGEFQLDVTIVAMK